MKANVLVTSLMSCIRSGQQQGTGRGETIIILIIIQKIEWAMAMVRGLMACCCLGGDSIRGEILD